jgi:hypothetical protein
MIESARARADTPRAPSVRAVRSDVVARRLDSVAPRDEAPGRPTNPLGPLASDLLWRRRHGAGRGRDARHDGLGSPVAGRGGRWPGRQKPLVDALARIAVALLPGLDEGMAEV